MSQKEKSSSFKEKNVKITNPNRYILLMSTDELVDHIVDYCGDLMIVEPKFLGELKSGDMILYHNPDRTLLKENAWYLELNPEFLTETPEDLVNRANVDIYFGKSYIQWVV